MYLNIPYMESIRWVRIEENFDHPTYFLQLWIVISFGFSLFVYSAWMIQSYWLFSSHKRCAIDSVVISHSVFLSQYNMLFTYSMVPFICSQIFEWHPNFDTASAISTNWKDVCFQRMSSCFRAQKIMFTHNLHHGINPNHPRPLLCFDSIRWVEVLSISSTLRIQIII